MGGKMGKEKFMKFGRRLIITLCLTSIIISLIPSYSADIIENEPPVADAGGPYIGYEGTPVLLDASGSYDPDNDPLFYNWDFDGDGNEDLRFWIDDPTIYNTWDDDFEGNVTVFVDDASNHISNDSALVTIYNLDPIITSIDGLTIDPIQIGDTVSFTCTFTDAGIFDTHKGHIKWDDGTEVTVTISDYSFSGTHSYTDPGVYTVTIMVEDDDGGYDIEFPYIVVYDPNSDGFVTGGGWIDSPEGAYSIDTTLCGKATFGFVSKYKKGQTIPSGNTEFQFHVAGLNFHSTEYEWLIVAGSKANFKGSGTINGEGNYSFMITAIDGDLKDNEIDKFRIKIWDKDEDETIYDNAVNQSITELEGGQIVIHKK